MSTSQQSNNNQNKGISRKNMIQYLINTNKTRNLCKPYDIDMISELINNYNNYSKKVIHNIISNILNKESFEKEIDTIKIIIDNIIEGILINTDKELLYIDTIIFIIDKLFLYGRINKDDNNSRYIILHYMDNALLKIPVNKKYKCYDTILNYIGFYLESFKNNTKPVHNPGNVTNNRSYDNSNIDNGDNGLKTTQ